MFSGQGKRILSNRQRFRQMTFPPAEGGEAGEQTAAQEWLALAGQFQRFVIQLRRPDKIAAITQQVSQTPQQVALRPSILRPGSHAQAFLKNCQGLMVVPLKVIMVT